MMYDDNRSYILIDGIYNREYTTFHKNKTFFKYFDMLSEEWVYVSFTNGSKYNCFNNLDKISDDDKKPYLISVEKSNWPKELCMNHNYISDDKPEKVFKNFRISRNDEYVRELKQEHPEYFI